MGSKTARILAVLILVAGFAFALADDAGADEVYSPHDDFALTSNPNGVWSYGSRSSAASTSLSLFEDAADGTFSGISGTSGWYDGDTDGLNWHPSVWMNVSGSDITFQTTSLPTGMVFLHPDFTNATNPFPVLRFTAPEDGDYEIDAEFSGRAPETENAGNTTTVVYVVKNGTSLMSGSIVGGPGDSGSVQSYAATLTLSEGDVLDFVVTTEDAAYYDTTGLDLTITLEEDDTPPSVSCSTDVSSIWPPNHRMVDVGVTLTATDEGNDVSDLELLDVTVASDEADNGLGDGDRSGDVDGSDGYTSPVDVTSSFTYDGDDESWTGTVSLRAERSGTGDGRTYTITVRFRDPAGNIGTATCTVTVPLSR